MSASRPPLTQKGADRLRDELEYLKRVKRPEIVAAVAEARAHGDLKENAEYHAAREMHGFNEGRIAELEAALSNSEVIDTERLGVGKRIVFGAIVDLVDVDTDAEVTYQIVGDLEADIKQNLIAVSSPIARALIGKSEGDEFDFTAPNGVKTFEIKAVRYS
ncbi:transcription elongation factor GreA [Luteibacter sp. RCC_6_2]|mgnify:CR=1 FL=1|jgi:transcription elongation factor GreA|uniref:transcription elongation factor GreA n=1 Tax=Luteibacter sp. RCC_6_2 TaxID=3239223 RepID=UPI0035264CE6